MLSVDGYALEAPSRGPPLEATSAWAAARSSWAARFCSRRMAGCRPVAPEVLVSPSPLPPAARALQSPQSPVARAAAPLPSRDDGCVAAVLPSCERCHRPPQSHRCPPQAWDGDSTPATATPWLWQAGFVLAARLASLCAVTAHYPPLSVRRAAVPRLLLRDPVARRAPLPALPGSTF